jgi:hypothetical protein
MRRIDLAFVPFALPINSAIIDPLHHMAVAIPTPFVIGSLMDPLCPPRKWPSVGLLRHLVATYRIGDRQTQ